MKTAVDLDRLVQDFSLLEQKITELQGRNSISDIKLDENTRLLKLWQSKENCMKEESAALQSTIKGLQDTIQQQCDLRDENQRLKKAIHVFEDKKKANDKEQSSRVERLLMDVQSLKQEHQAELCELQQDAKRRLEMKEAELKEFIVRQESEIQEMKKKLRDQDREKQGEIIKLQMEFSAKLARMQSTSVKAHQQDPSILPQNIFKRKLQFMQEEKNREIEVLRCTIKELEQKCGSSHDSRLKRRKF
ncbi:coiled-coil domain-containing protein 152 [Amia ocellicauda]|uniref:coiled-coil domain-containing protein 152 n=1 Tax=Amia ocellicauda TaxID=2972642 RepID=UPI003463A315